MSSLAGKKVLLVAPLYYGYEGVIKEGLENLGAQVTYIENKAFRYDPINKGTAWYEAIFCKKNQYLKKILPVARKVYDICFFVDLFSFHPSFIREVRKQNPKIRCVLYLWDNIKYYKWEQFFSHFDALTSFD